MNDNVINEAFVQELLKSGVWDIARARPKQVDESAKATAEDKAKAVETKDKKEESQQEQTSAEIAENLVKTLDEKVIFEVINFLHNVVNESEDDREVTPEMKLAEETLKDLDKEVISEFVSILYAVAVNESKEKVEDIDEKYNRDLCDYVVADNHEKAIEIAKELELGESENFELDKVRGTEVICTEYRSVQLPKEGK